jgi:hypothetical protein
VKPKAALLAGFLGVTNQHSLGSLVEWWELNGDVRELERIVANTPEGEEPKVVVTAEMAALRFRLASGHQIDPLALESLGLLERLPEPGSYRVRGMSRFFKPVVDRLTSRAKASAGGKASAEARKKAFGTAQPRSASGSEPRSASGSKVVREVFELVSSTAQSPTELHRTLAVSGQRSDHSSLRPPSSDVAGEAPKMRKLVQHTIVAAPDGGQEIDLGSPEVIARHAEAWLDRAQALRDALGHTDRPGNKAREWCAYFFAKYQPEDRGERLLEAFRDFLTWCTDTSKSPGWGLWLREDVWGPRWDTVRVGDALAPAQGRPGGLLGVAR